MTRSIGGLERSLNSPRLSQAGRQLGMGLARGAAVGIAGVGLLAFEIKQGLNQLVELESQTAQTNAVIKSTGGVAGISAKQVRDLAEEYESLNATIDDKVIQSAENLLLTFTSVNKDAFEPALAAALDMNQALGGGEGGLQGTIIQVGKALQDPIRGLTALRRVGVNFTKDQEKQIKALVETGDVMGAQKIILGELNREFGGSFLAGGGTTAGKVAKFQDSIEDLQKALATALLPTIGRVADKLSAFLADPQTVATVERLGDQIGSLFSDENIAKGAEIVRGAFETVKGALPGLKDAAVITGQVLSTAVGLFKSLPPGIQNLAIGALAVNKLTGGLATNVIGGLAGLALSSLKTITAANVTVIGGSVTGTGGVGGAAAAAGGASRIGSAVRILGTVALAAGSIALIGELIGQKQAQTAANVAGEKALAEQTKTFGDSATIQDMRNSLEGIERYAEELNWGLTPEAIAYQLNIDGVRDAVDATKSTLKTAIESKIDIMTAAVVSADAAERRGNVSQEGLLGSIAAKNASTIQHLEDLRATTSSGLSKTAYESQQAAAAIRDKNFTPRITVNTTVNTSVSVRDQQLRSKSASSYGFMIGGK